MRANTEKLNEALRAVVGRPARTIYRENYKTALIWYADNHDDRYVMVEDSSASDDFVVIVRDFGRVSSKVLADIPSTVGYVKLCLDYLASRSGVSVPGPDWTCGSDNRFNSSPEFESLVEEVSDLIFNLFNLFNLFNRHSAHDLICGRTKTVAALIMARLAHTHGLAPTWSPQASGLAHRRAGVRCGGSSQ